MPVIALHHLSLLLLRSSDKPYRRLVLLHIVVRHIFDGVVIAVRVVRPLRRDGGEEGSGERRARVLVPDRGVAKALPLLFSGLLLGFLAAWRELVVEGRSEEGDDDEP